MKKIALKYFNSNVWIVFIIICILYSIALTLEFKYVFTDAFYLKSFEKAKSYDTILNLIKKEQHAEWLNYFFVIIVVLLPSFLISICLYTGSILKEYNLKLKDLFRIAVKSQIIFAFNYLIAVILRVTNLLPYNYASVNNNYDFQSVKIFFRNYDLPYWLNYPLQNINLTEVFHLLILSIGVQTLTKLSYSKSINFVLKYFGIGFFFWIILIVFLQTIL